MKVSILAAATILLTFVSPLSAQMGFMRGISQQRIARTSGDRIKVTGMSMEPTTVAKEVEVAEPGGQMRKEMITEEQWVYESFVTVHAAEDLRAYTADRKKLEPSDLLKRLANDTVVFVCEPQEKADPAYISLLKPETICLFLPMFQQDSAEEQDDASPPVLSAPSAPAKSTAQLIPKSLPNAAQPEAALAMINSSGKLLLRRRMITTVENTAYQNVDQDGRSQMVPVSIKTTMTNDQLQELPASAIRTFDTAGKPVAAADVTATLAVERAVLVSNGDEPIDPAFLEVIKPDTLILFLPSTEPPAPIYAPQDGAAPVE